MVFNIGILGSTVQLPEYLFHDKEFSIKMIICEKSKLNDELLTFSLIRNVDIYSIDEVNEILDIIDEIGDIDFLVMCSFGKCITPDLIKKLKIYNIHYSNLPSYKGRHPTFWATINDENEIGITIHNVTENFDEGTIISQYAIPYYLWMTEDDVFYKLSMKIPDLITDLKYYLCGNIVAENNKCGSYYPPVKERDFTIDLENDSYNAIFNKIRAQKRYKGAKIILNNTTIWLKEIQFTKMDQTNKNGEIYFNSEGSLCIYIRDSIGMKCIDYFVESGD